MLMKKWIINPIGPLVVEYLKEHASSLYDYLLKKKPNEELVAENITDDIDKHFRAGFALHWDHCLNHWMVDYDIIRILKGYIGYSSWTDVPTKQMGLFYKNYNQNVTLPEWDIEQERYWHFVTRDSAYSGWIHIKPIIKPIYQNIPFWNTSIWLTIRMTLSGERLFSAFLQNWITHLFYCLFFRFIPN